MLQNITMQLSAIAEGNNKLAALTFTCAGTYYKSDFGKRFWSDLLFLGELFAITAAQSDHSLYSVDTSQDRLSFVADLDASNKGNGIAYEPRDAHIYRIGGVDPLDIEQIDYSLGNITSELLCPYYRNSK